MAKKRKLAKKSTLKDRRMFEAHYYYYSVCRKTKREAFKTANNFRKKGYRVRVVKEKKCGSTLYTLWKRHKKDF